MQGRVLVVDDNPQNLKLAYIVLSSEGMDVRTSTTAEQALQAVEEFSPDVVLTDLKLPGMDGFELTRRLKANPSRRHVAIVALTGRATKEAAQQARAAGFDDFITKPIDTENLPIQVLAHIARVRGGSA